MTTHPYIGSSGPIVQIIQHLRRSFQSTVDADTLKRLGIAAKSESYLINILKFIGIIDTDGKKTDKASKIFSLHDDAKFKTSFAELVKSAYTDLFADHGEASWKLDNNALITFFRQIDETSGIVGARQATTFRALSALSGHAEIRDPKSNSAAGQKDRKPKKSNAPPATLKNSGVAAPHQPPAQFSALAPFGLSVRVEVNLPADANQ